MTASTFERFDLNGCCDLSVPKLKNFTVMRFGNVSSDLSAPILVCLRNTLWQYLQI